MFWPLIFNGIFLVANKTDFHFILSLSVRRGKLLSILVFRFFIFHCLAPWQFLITPKLTVQHQRILIVRQRATIYDSPCVPNKIQIESIGNENRNALALWFESPFIGFNSILRSFQFACPIDDHQPIWLVQTDTFAFGLYIFQFSVSVFFFMNLWAGSCILLLESVDFVWSILFIFAFPNWQQRFSFSYDWILKRIRLREIFNKLIVCS